MSFSNHSLILKNDGTLWGCGANGNGQLGLGDTNNRSIFTQITTNADNIKSVYCSYNQTFVLKNDNTLWGCGLNSQGQLGLGDTNNRTTLTQITTNVDDIKSIYCGKEYIIILKNDGALWGCGDNSYGQLGLGDTKNRTTFTQITNNVKSIYCGYNHTLILKNDGTLWGCGRNDSGQLGLEKDINNKITFTQITTNADNIKSIYCGNEYTTILKNNGTLWGCGSNGYGLLGFGDYTNKTTITIIGINSGNIKEVCPGGAHMTILKNDNTLWGCGLNDSGQLGLGDANSRTIFTQIINNVDNIKSVYGGYNHTLILKNDGTLWGCGHNIYGQLGLGNTSNKTILTQITTNVDDIKCFANDYGLPNIIKIYDSKIGYIETLETNNFRNISINTFEKLKVLYTKPLNTYVNCLISFDKKQTWKTFNGTTWTTISDISPENIILNCMDIETLNNLTKSNLIQAGFVGDLDFKVAIKTNNEKVTPSVSKIYIVYKNPF